MEERLWDLERWQVFPTRLREMLTDPDSGKRNRVMEQMLKMKKLDIAPLERAFAG